MTAITLRYGSGETHRCDAKCHNATHPECDCICAGVLHGAGSHTVELGWRISELVDEMFGVKEERGQMSLLAGQ
jgi:hypothetical protein